MTGASSNASAAFTREIQHQRGIMIRSSGLSFEMKHLSHPHLKGFAAPPAPLHAVLVFLLTTLALAPSALRGATVFSDNFSSSTLNSAAPAPPTTNSTAYQLLSSKPWSPTPAIAANDLKFGIGSSSSGHIEVQALFTTAPVTLASNGDFIELTVTFTNTTGLFAQLGHLGFGLYNSGGVAPIAGGMNATAVSGTSGVTGGAQGWQGYVARIAYDTGTHRLATRPAQTITTGNNQDLITEGSGSQSYLSGVNLASAASTFSVAAGSLLTENFRITLTAAGTLQIESKLYVGANTNGAILLSQTASGVTGANFLTNKFDALAIGWRATTNTLATLIDIKSIAVNASSLGGGSSNAVAGIYFEQQPTDSGAGATISPPVTIVATNSAGAPATNAAVTLWLLTGTGLLNGTLTRNTDSGGVATFNDLSLTHAGVKQLRATSGTVTADSATFNITNLIHAFPGAEGAGANALGGRGGDVYYVPP